MHQIRRIIEYHAGNLSDRQISKLTKVSRPTIAQYLVNFRQSGVTLENFRNMADSDALALLTTGNRTPDQKLLEAIAYFSTMIEELKQPHVTRQLLWKEYREKHPDGFGHSQFSHHFNVWRGALPENMAMHQHHKAGAVAFMDWAGKIPLFITDPKTGIKTTPQLYVCLLGASEYTYAEATPSQEQCHWISASRHALEYFEGVPAALTPDAYKGAVTTADKYDPVINRTFQDFAEHYGTVILPARPYKPKDKALVENMVRTLYTRLFAPLRKRVFHSLDELNEALWELLETHNRMPFQRLKVSRHDLWQSTEKPSLKSLPPTPYEFRQYKIQRVPNNYHIRISEDDHYYSVPWRLFGKDVTIIYSGRTVEVYHDNVRQAFHHRIHAHGWTTSDEHMPDHHRFVASWSPSRIEEWAGSTGPATRELCKRIMDHYQYPEHGYRACIGVIKLHKKWGKERLERACSLALEQNEPRYRKVKSILEAPEKRILTIPQAKQPATIIHENIRGQEAYQ